MAGQKSIMERAFWRGVNILGEHDCWEWKFARDRHGYGKMTLGGTAALAHRIAYELHNGPLPVYEGGQASESIVMHLCHNRLCCNPLHLKAGTNYENARMRVERWASDPTLVSRPKSPISVRRRQPAGKAAKSITLDGVEYESISQCFKQTGITRTTLRAWLRNGHKRVLPSTTGGNNAQE